MSTETATNNTSDQDTSKGYCHRIGVFDSGLGGLSVLSALKSHLPQANMLYVADSRHAPYGEKEQAFILQRSEIITDFLLQHGAQIIVIACNTATAAAVERLRLRWPEVPIVGVEPGVKPAVAHSSSGKVGVLATPGTLSSQKFLDLIRIHGRHADITVQPCPGLAAEIERGELDTPRLRELVAEFTRPLKEARVDTVVLGCTHYPFIRPLFEEALSPRTRLVDTSDAVARHVASIVAKLACPQKKPRLSCDATPYPAGGELRLWSSGDPKHLSQTVKRWLQIDVTAEHLAS